MCHLTDVCITDAKQYVYYISPISEQPKTLHFCSHQVQTSAQSQQRSVNISCIHFKITSNINGYFNYYTDVSLLFWTAAIPTMLGLRLWLGLVLGLWLLYHTILANLQNS